MSKTAYKRAYIKVMDPSRIISFIEKRMAFIKMNLSLIFLRQKQKKDQQSHQPESVHKDIIFIIQQTQPRTDSLKKEAAPKETRFLRSKEKKTFKSTKS